MNDTDDSDDKNGVAYIGKRILLSHFSKKVQISGGSTSEDLPKEVPTSNVFHKHVEHAEFSMAALKEHFDHCNIT